MIDLYWELFFTFFKIGLFGFGGGYAMLSMVQYEVVEAHGWLTMGEFTDIVAISQMTPGPIIVNSATYIGYTATGGSIVGSLTATCAVCLPAILIMVLICRFFMMFKNEHNFVDYRSVLIALGAFVLAYCFKIGIIRLIIIAGLTGYLVF